MRVTVAAVQMASSPDRDANLERVEALIRRAAAAGAGLVVTQEMVSRPMFMFGDWTADHYALAEELDGPTVTAMRSLARELGLVLPVNFFERANQAHYNTTVVIDADGAVLGHYRKSHIPAGPPACYEKMYTNPGDTGFRVFDTAVARIGPGICWDQWFPESARVMAIKGARAAPLPHRHRVRLP